MNKPNKPKRLSFNLKKTRQNYLAGGLILIALFWSVLYLPNLRTSPPWYGDEILTLDIGKSLIRGEMVNRAMYCTFASFNYNYQPAFAFFVGLCSSLTNGDILGGRLFSVSLSLFTALLGYWFLGRRFGFGCGFFFALLLLGYSQAIIHYRWIYPHNMVGLGLFAATCLLMRPANPRKDLKAGLFLSLGAGSHLLALHSVIVSIVLRLFRPRSWFSIGLPPLLLMGGTILAINFVWNGWAVEDLKNLQSTYQAYSKENAPGWKWLENIALFFMQDKFHWAAAIGAAICLRRRAYALALSTLCMVFILTKNRQNLPLFYYQAMVVLPLLAATIAVASRFLCNTSFRKLAASRLRRGGRFFLPLFGVFLALINIPSVLSSRLPVRIHPWVVAENRDYETAAAWLNARTRPSDLVICYWNLGWLLKCRNADVLMVTAWHGLPAGDNYDPLPARDRFRFSLEINQAKYFVITELDERWAYGQGSVFSFLKDAGVFSWPLVFQSGFVRILQNPSFVSDFQK